MKLHLGCGNKILSGFINVDLRAGDGIDKVEDVASLPSFQEDSVDLIYACHVLEHFSRHDRLDVLHRWNRILKKDGVIRIAVPDFEKVVTLYKEHNIELSKLIGFLYGGQNHKYNYHHYCWDFASLKLDLEQCNFYNIVRYDWKKTEHYNIDDYSQSYWPHMDKDHGLLMSLNVEAKKSV